jgi:hypothetical protein
MSTTKPVSNSFIPDRDAATGMINEGMQIAKAQLASAAVLPQKIWETQFTLASEILGFMGRRLQSQAAFCARISRCKDIGEAVDAQQDFAKGAGDAYAEEAEKLSTLARKSLDSWTGAGAQYMSAWTHSQKVAASPSVSDGTGAVAQAA